MNICPFCLSTDTALRYAQVSHPTVKAHGPFDLYVCGRCGSCSTYPEPDPSSLKSLYAGFASGLQPRVQDARDREPLDAWDEANAERASRLARVHDADSFDWLEVGAGAGGLASKLATRFPNSQGLAVDWHERPEKLAELDQVAWRSLDLNQADFATNVGRRFDLVVSIAVWEHVLQPRVFMRQLLELVKPGGALLVATPDYGSLARKVLEQRWPYFSPGEHIHIPTRRGARFCIRQLAVEAGHDAGMVFDRAACVPYPVGYVLRFLRLDRVADILPVLPVPLLPTGLLEAGLKSAGAK